MKDIINPHFMFFTDKDSMENKNLLCVNKIELSENYVLVELQGAIDSVTIPKSQKQGKNLKDQFDKHVILDFKKVEHIDCSTLAVLISLFSELKSYNKKLVIINPINDLISYIDILCLKSIIHIFSSRKVAIKFLSNILDK